jgi:hypothetical protein
MDSMTRTIAAVVLAAGITALVYMDDQMAGENKKNARYTRLFITATGIGWFLMPIIVRQLVGGQGSQPVMMMGAAPPMQQHFNVGPSPF